MTKRLILGLTEEISIFGKDNKEEKLRARIDTGATASSVDIKLAEKLGLGPVIRTKLVKSASGKKVRDIVMVEVNIKGKLIKGEFSLANREGLSYSVLIGQNVLKEGYFLVDPLINKDNKE